MKTINEFINEKLNLNSDSKINPGYKDKLNDLYNKYIKPALNEYNSGGRSRNSKYEIIKNCRSYCNRIIDLIVNLDIDKDLKIARRFSTCVYASYDRFGFSENASIDILKRKNDSRICSHMGMPITFSWDIDKKDQWKYDMYKIDTYVRWPLIFGIYKDGTVSMTMDVSRGMLFPKDKEHIKTKLEHQLQQIGIKLRWQYSSNFEVSQYKLTDKLSISEALQNTFTGHVANMDGFMYDDIKGKRQDLFDRFLNVLKIYDSRVSFKDTDTRKKDDYLNIIGELTFKRKTFKFELLFSHFGGDNYDFYIKLDGESIIELKSHTTHWDAGFASTDHKLGVNVKLIDKNFKDAL